MKISKQNRKFDKNWLVTQFNGAGVQIKQFEIKDKYQWEASEIASNESVKNKNCDDWSLVAIKT